MLQVKDDATLTHFFTTRKSTGLPTVLTGSPLVRVYVDDSATELSAGITLSPDYDSVVGFNKLVIDLSASASYVVGKDYAAVLTAGTVDGISVIGEVVLRFRIEKDTPFDFLRAAHAGVGTFGEVSTVSDLLAASLGTGLGTLLDALQPVRKATAQAGGASTITLDASASAVNDFYAAHFIQILSGTGAGQTNFISAYVGSTKVATVRTAWATIPDNTSVFLVR